MTTLVPFTPSLAPSSPPFQFQATLDGQQYNCVVKWNLYSQRWFIQVFSLSDTVNPILTQGLVGSSNAAPLASLTWSDRNGGTVEATTEAPHWVPLGRVVTFTIAGALPAALNGVWRCVADSPTSFYYPLSSDPGNITAAGSFSYDVNVVGGYFASRLVYRLFASRFEVSP